MAADQGLHLRVAREALREGGVEEVGGALLQAQAFEIEFSEEEIVDDENIEEYDGCSAFPIAVNPAAYP